jgi:hypothetical protein
MTEEISVQTAPAAPAEGAAADGVGWLDAVGDPELKAWARNKNFPSLQEALASQRRLEKLLGSEKVPLPKDPGDREGWDRVWRALGRPDAPAGYGLEALDGADPDFARTASEWFHQAGLGERQARNLAEAFTGYMRERLESDADQRERAGQAEMAALRRDWGDRFDAQAEQARRAARVLGVDGEAMGALEHALGPRRFMTLFARIGAHFAEDSFVEGEGGRGFAMSPEDARARIKALTADRAWAKAYLDGDAAKRAEMERLNRAAAAG